MQPEKAEFTDVNEHFKGKYNAEITLSDNFFLVEVLEVDGAVDRHLDNIVDIEVLSAVASLW